MCSRSLAVAFLTFVISSFSVQAETPEGRAMVESGAATANEAWARDDAAALFDAAMADPNKPVGSRAGHRPVGYPGMPLGATWNMAIQKIGGTATVRKGCAIGEKRGDCLDLLEITGDWKREVSHFFVEGRLVLTTYSMSKGSDGSGWIRPVECYPIAAKDMLTLIKAFGLPDDGPPRAGASFKPAVFSFEDGSQIEYEIVEVPTKNSCRLRAFFRAP
jgi:hypothetical protein